MCDVGNGAGGEEKFLNQAPMTNQNPSVTAILEQCLSLSTGTSVSQFVSHPSQYTDMLCMTLGESLTGVSDTQPAWLQMQC